MRSIFFCTLVCVTSLAFVACDKKSEDTLVQVSKDNPEMIAAREEALKRYPEFQAAFEKRRVGDVFLVKTGFAVRGSEDHEYMWVEVQQIKGDVLSGTLANDPVADVELRNGDSVSVNRADVFDWMYGHKGRKPIGGFQEAVLLKLEKEGK
ncbi:MAG: DUF2314 domain-containing protein [Phycisphaeraceae bacterium]|nr:DUF2314 domain-containing protein [Phycisphaeraceae bacterium]